MAGALGRAHLRRDHRAGRGRGSRRGRGAGRVARLGEPGIIDRSRRTRVSRVCWGVFRESTHSPGRESDDTEILRLTGKHLEAKGFHVELKTADEVTEVDADRPRFVFLMCERTEVLDRLRALEVGGVPHVNSPRAVHNTYRDRMIAVLDEANVPFIPSRIVGTSEEPDAEAYPVWVKRGDVHNTQGGDVVLAPTPAAIHDALRGLAARGIPRAV